MNKVNLKYVIGAFLFFCAALLAYKFQPAFGEIDLSDERATMIADMNQQSEDIEEIQDVFGSDYLSEEDVTQILNGEAETAVAKKEEVQKPVPKKEPVKVAIAQETQKETAIASALKKEETPVVTQPKIEPAKVKKPVQVALVPEETPKEMPKEAPKKESPKVQPAKEEVVPVAEAPVKKEVPVVVQPKVEPAKEEKPVQVAMIPKETPKPAPVENIKEAPKKEVIPEAAAPVKQASVKKGPAKPVKKVSLKELQGRLALTDAQVKRLTPIMKQKGERRTEIIKKYAGKGEQARSAFMHEMQLFREYYDDMYSHIMTEEQWNQYIQIREEQKNQASS